VAGMLRKVGFGEPTSSFFPGERAGEFVVPKVRDIFGQAVQSFGYGFSVTTLQLAQAYATFGAGGLKRPVSLLKLDPEQVPAGERVMSPETAHAVMEMMRSVLEPGGSGTRARIPGYQVVGKSGTTRKLGPNGYLADSHRSVFAGLVPASKPKFVMVVMIDDPKGKEYYGGAVAAPIFAKVMAGALRFFAVPPDAALPTPLVKQ